MKKRFAIVLLLPAVAIWSCKKADNTTTGNVPKVSTGGYTNVTIGHDGFDFSAGVPDTVNWQDNDGDVIGWHPGSVDHPTYTTYGGYVWFRNSQVDTVTYLNQTKDYGDVDITSIKDVPATWDSIVDPLMVGHVIVAKCLDGYVKFEVLDTNIQMWQADIKYLYTSSGSFTQ